MDETHMTIGRMCETFGVSARTLRFYETKKLLFPIRQGQKRLFTKRDRARLKLILKGKRFGFSLEEIRQLLDLYKSDQDPQIQIKQAHERAECQLKALEAKKQELEEIIDDLRSQLAWGKNLLSTRAPLKSAIRHFDQ